MKIWVEGKSVVEKDAQAMGKTAALREVEPQGEDWGWGTMRVKSGGHVI